MATLNHQLIGYVGTDITFQASTAIDGTEPSTRCFLWVKNGSGVSTTITISVPGTTFEQANPDPVITIPAGQERFIGPLNPEIQTFGSTQVAWVTSPTTSVTIAAAELPLPSPDLP